MTLINEEEIYKYPFGSKVIRYLTEKYGDAIMHRNVDTLYHYTNITGLKGIIETKGFWISSIRFLNDYKEYVHGLDLCLELITEQRSNVTSENELQLLNELENQLFNSPNEHFVLSFCEDGDLLSQWRGYGQGKYGVSLGFKYSDFHNMIFRDGSNDRIFAFPVIYNDETKELILREILRIGLESSKRSELSFIGNIAGMIMESIQYYVPYFKHSAFADEREWRSVHTNFLSTKPEEHYPVQFRQRGSILLPYIEVQLNDIFGSGKNYQLKPRLPLHDVIVAPSDSQELTLESIQYYLTQQGMNGVKVRKSDIPFRW